jgi:hypothetical protein
MIQSHTNVGSGIAVLESTNPAGESTTWNVSGVALSEDTTTLGGSGRRRFWPSEALRGAASALEGRHIVKNFHDLQGTADADDVIGKITRSGYEPGVGVVFEGEILDEDIARKVEHDFLDVSSVPGIAEESYDASRDAYVVEEISGWRDIAVVPDGADSGNEITLEANSAVAALSREVLSQEWDALQESDEDSEQNEDDSEPETDTEDGPDSDSDSSNESSGLRAALEHEVGLTGSTPDRCKTIKDGAMTIDPEKSQAAQAVLNLEDDSGPSTVELSGAELASAQDALGFGEREEQSWNVTRTSHIDTNADGQVDLDDDPLALPALQTETLQDDDRTPQPGDAVRWQSDSGGSVSVDGESYRYGVIVDGMQDDDEDTVLVAVYEPDGDGDGWDNRNEENPMDRNRLEVVGTDGIESLPPVSQVT